MPIPFIGETVEPALTFNLINDSKVPCWVLGITWQIKLPSLSIIPKTGVLSFQLRPWEWGTFLSQWRFLFLPPIKVSSISTLFFNIVLKLGCSKAQRKRCKTNQVDFWVMEIYLTNWREKIPFLFEARR